METYNGHVRTPTDAIILFEACRLGLLPRVQRRLSEKERQLIRSGSVFVWDEREAGMRRWTDGKSWSASRVSGSFLTYREMEGKRGGNNTAATPSANGRTPDSPRNSADEATQTQQLDPEEGPDGYRYKPDGLMKQSFSITTSQGQHLHLISYYARSHPTAPGLRQPSNDPNLSQIQPAKGMYPETTVNDQSSVPAVTQSPMAGAPNYAMAPQSPYVRQGPGATHPQGYMMPGYPSYLGYPQGPPGQPPPGYAHVPYPPHVGLPPPGYHSVPPYGYPQHTPFSQPPPGFDQRPIHNPDNSRPPSQQLPPALRPPVPSSQPNGTYSISQPPLQSYQQPAYARPPPVTKAEKSPAPAIQIDPRLMGGPAQQEAPQANGNTRDALPTEQRRENGSVQVTASQAPTIGALVNKTSSMSNQNGVNDLRDRQGSTSPGGTKKSAPQMQDIPSEKLGFREDSRALRQLDKVFAA